MRWTCSLSTRSSRPVARRAGLHGLSTRSSRPVARKAGLHGLSRGLAVLTAGLLCVSLVTALVAAKPERADPPPAPPPKVAKPREVVPLFAITEPATNAPALIVLPDECGVRGWVAGEKSYAGAKVTITAGQMEFEATVGADNTFHWAHTSEKPQPLAFSLATGTGKRLTARTTLPARPEGTRRTAFVITDRSAYRPGHTLKFVAYVHDTVDGIDFKPVADREYTVDVTSETRGTRAARLKLRSDAAGRLTGQYTFTDADALDHYRIAVAPPDEAAALAGGARVLLGEYRKTKVGMKLRGEVKDGKLLVTFDARDYLDRPVKGTSASWSAVVTKAAEVNKLALDPAAFVIAETGPPSADDFSALPDDERLLTLANGVSAASFAGFGARTVATREGTAEFAGDGPGSVNIDLLPEWLRGQHSVALTAAFVDETGRENRAVGTFPLTPVGEKAIAIAAPKEVYRTGENVPVTVTPVNLGARDAYATTVVVVELEAASSALWLAPQYSDEDGELAEHTRIPPLGAGKPKKKPAADGWKSLPVFDPVKRKVLTAVPVVNGRAEVDLKHPGAYKLLAVTRLADGTTLQAETGVVVKAPAKMPGVVLQLDARELSAGGHLTGTVHTRFAGAKMLLTLRDSGGVKLAKPLTAGANGTVRVDEVLPPNLRYGCSVCVQYPESAANVFADQHDLFVAPTDRTLTVSTTAPDTVGPGADVRLNFRVNREEEVDLVVSVFDESLLGVSGDLSGNIRDFYLADARGQGRAARDLAATRLGNVRIADLVLEAEAVLKDPDALAKEPGLKHRLETLTKDWKDEGKVKWMGMVTLVRLARLEVYLAGGACSDLFWEVPKSARLGDLFHLDTLDNGGPARLSATVIDNVVLIALAHHNGQDPWALHRGHFYPNGYAFGGYQFQGFNGFGSQFGQFGGFGNLGAQFGIQGGVWNMGFSGGGFGGGFGGGGFGGGGFGGRGFGFGGGVPSVAGIQGSFSHPGGNMGFSQPFVGGQMGMSFGFNRDFGAGPPLPALGVGNDVVRRDFADSAFWTAALRTDKTGRATAAFKVPDSLTNWRVQVTAVSPKMHVGSATSRFKTTRPIMIWPMLPRTFAEGDVVRVFGTVHNLTDREQNVRVHLKAENGAVLSAGEQVVTVPANGNVPAYWTYRAGKPGTTDLLMSATCAAGSDASLKKLPVVASTVPERVTVSGLVGKDDLKLTMPAGFDPKTAQVTVTVAPTLAADLADTLPYLVEYPYGCVEQTMSRFLPALRVGLILKQSGISTIKQLEEKLPKVVEAGQKRLIELQQPDGGWAWQGSGQTHEMMTPYAMFGLLAAEEAGYPCPNPGTIDRGMGRLRQYLDQSAGLWDLTIKQGWDAALAKPNGGRDTDVNDALFCLWVAALDADRLKKQGTNLNAWFARIDKTVGRAEMSDTGHALALELAAKHGQKPLADKLAAELRKRAQKAGDRVFWTKAGFSRWADNTTEVTATVMKALVAQDPKDPLIPGALAYFHSTKRGDRWDSTKDTACVLYALCDYLVAVRAGPAAAGSVKIALNGTGAGAVTLDSAASKSVRFAGTDLKAGGNTFRVTGAEASGGALVHVTVSFTRTGGTRTPARDHGVMVTRTVTLRGADGQWTELKSGASVPVGSYLKVNVTAVPRVGSLQYFLIESPKPAGCETISADERRFPAAQNAQGHVLREDREAMSCFHYESAASATAEFVVLAEFAGDFTLPPARGEQMYQPTSGGHSDSFLLKVTPKK
ncbi:alpha-2-macroglobulin family protein [Frigoriglobus tundricola]|uniref:Alpha-2-macroglobulin domain-containing protein n=1 Tax=Frigoriglobus tundricola TaxID=2774151 RepID=A0A6M5YV81_9BACT|nr:alpha-2-macroglobulin family protein [Frigoriglobus tundricola]QJW96822.1 hypothetical protein FTUN_4382 [Frigoriglobus tundricola]